jgi:hypothetical protein
MTEEYEVLYSDFIKNYSIGVTTGEEAGLLVAKLAGYYPNFSAILAKNERAYALISRDEVLKTEDATGKQISATKAQTLADASNEAFAYKEAKMHVTNLEVLIQSAKSLQRGLLQEMSHSNL